MLHHLIYDKLTSLRLKGIAILFMLIFHLFTPNPTYNMGDVLFSFSGIDKLLGIFCNRTVPIYLFITGYALAMHTLSWRKIFQKTIFIYKRIWLLALIFIPTLLFAKKIQWSFSIFLHTITLGDGYIRIWWYASFYIMILCLYTLYDKISLPIRKYFSCFFILISLCTYFFIDDDKQLPYYVNRFSKFTIFLILGIVSYKTNLFGRIKTNRLVSCFIFILIFLLDFTIKDEVLYKAYRLVTFPMLMVCLIDICDNKIASGFLNVLGKHSTNIWLIHGFFFYYYAEYTYLPRYFIFVLFTFLFINIIASHLFNKLCNISIDKIMHI